MTFVLCLLLLAVGVVTGYYLRKLDAIYDWRDGYEACKRDWDDWERARTGATSTVAVTQESE